MQIDGIELIKCALDFCHYSLRCRAQLSNQIGATYPQQEYSINS